MPLRLTSPTVGLALPAHSRKKGRRPTVRLRAHAANAKIRRNRGSSPGARSARITVERIRITSQSAAAAPSAGRMAGANVGPLAEIGFTQDHGTGLTQLRGDESVGWWARSEQRQRSRRRIHAIRGIDIVLDEHRNA